MRVSASALSATTSGGGRCTLWTVGALALLVTGAQCAESSCVVGCCTLLPTCAEPTLLDCNCYQRPILPPGREQRPKLRYVRNIVISNTTDCTVEIYATNGLPSLESMTFVNITQMTIQRMGFSLKSGDRLRSLVIQSIDSLTIEDLALTGSWNTNAIITMEDIGKLSVRERGFGFVSPGAGPSVRLRRIKTLQASHYAFSATINQLTLEDVVMPFCGDICFVGNIVSLDMNRVMIDEVTQFCVHGLASWREFSIRSSVMGHVGPYAFAGKLHGLSVHASNFTRIYEDGIHFQLNSFKMSSSNIDTLESNGLTLTIVSEHVVGATYPVVLEDVSVGTLHKNALMSLYKSVSTGDQPLTIRRLRVGHAETESLAFAKYQSVAMSGLEFGSGCGCPVQAWARRLVSNTSAAELSPAQRQLVELIRSAGRCVAADGRSVAVSDWRCGGGGGSTPYNWPVYGVLVALALLAMAVLVVLIVRRGRNKPTDVVLQPLTDAGTSPAAASDDHVDDDVTLQPLTDAGTSPAAASDDHIDDDVTLQPLTDAGTSPAAASDDHVDNDVTLQPLTDAGTSPAAASDHHVDKQTT